MSLEPAFVLDLSVEPIVFRVSPPGINALTGAEADMLIAVGNRPAQIIQAGLISVPASGNVSILWPFTLLDRPMIEFQSSSTAGELRLPYHYNHGARTTITCSVSLTGATFVSSGIAREVSYVAVARVLP